MTLLTTYMFARGFFMGPADWMTAGGALILILCLFGHFLWLLWMIGFAGWNTRNRKWQMADGKMNLLTSADSIKTRSALVMSIYHEDVERVAAGVRQIWLSAKQAGLEENCDYFILSDSVRSEIRRAEEDAVQELTIKILAACEPFGCWQRRGIR